MTDRATAAIHTGYWGLHLTGLALFLAIVRAPHARAGALPFLWAALPVVSLAMAPSAAAFYASYGHTDAHVDGYIAATAEAFAEIGRALERGEVEKQLKGPVAHAGFYRLT